MKASLYPFLRPYSRETIAGLFLKFIEAVLELLLPLLLARIIDIGISGRDIPYIYKTGSQMFAIIVAGLICAVICQYCAAVAAQGFGNKLRITLFRKINRMSLIDQRRFGTESLINRVTSDTERLQLAVSMLIRLGSRIPFVVIGGVVAAVLVDLPLSGVIIAGAVAFLLVAAVIIMSVFPQYTALQSRLDRIGKILRESFLGVRVIRAFRRINWQKDRFDEAVDEHRKIAVRAAKISSFMQPSTQLIMNLAICGILWFGAGRVNSGELTTGQIVAMINYILQILVALILVANLTVIFIRAASSRKRVEEILAFPVETGKGAIEERAETEESSPGPIAEHAVQDEYDRPTPEAVMEFRNVTFRYPGTDESSETRDALRDISFIISAGETLAVTGTTGSGKSTLISLMLRLSEPTGGQILLSGLPIPNLSVSDLRRRIAVVHQAPRLFSGTVEENIRWGNGNASTDDIRKALETAQAWDFVSAIPEGIFARVERNGRNFSGGQRQRIAIARALAKSADVLVLDDSASALDYLTEARLFSAIASANCGTGRALVVISQRIAAIRRADRILVLDEGRQAGFGTHEHLLRVCPEYKAIVDSQLFGKEAT